MIVSFIIVAYNAEKTVDDILNNLTEQDYEHKKIEVLLVDSASSDSTKKQMVSFCENFQSEFKRICVLDNPKRTLPCGWNVALKEVKGDVILRVDVHTTIPDDFISMNVNCLKGDENICGGRVTSTITNNSIWQRTILLAENSMFGGGVAKFRRSNTCEYVNTLAFAAYRRCVFETVGGYDERLARTEDNEIHYRMKQAGYKFLYYPRIHSFRMARCTLFKLMKQKYFNGYWIGLTMGVSPRCFSLYHFVPFAFVLGIIVTSILAAFALAKLALLLWSFYWAIAILMAVLSVDKGSFNSNLFALPFLFFLLHISYGSGTIVGLVKMPFSRKLKRACYEIENVKLCMIDQVI